ncbi:hypothetical protein SARC_02075 [Sphaeroforma arctica JP610]|uniref:Uncharacterized protein n=1 Tax=Sphaeroforma arctica JP610 TaxID=667725 RepID=A0A0L0GA63_9EUKA|nr:hypothetical protein SARC_02075 [Sphaeroforma arctica JP610]KNC85771.1 hypothetical protein SARC_02075 [Sphaeroforma arctica JP610]|eukprot:XP_014159673.1 hypothetical protein SARC_02075 [Sphaeroforma arctica JP610]
MRLAFTEEDDMFLINAWICHTLEPLSTEAVSWSAVHELFVFQWDQRDPFGGTRKRVDQLQERFAGIVRDVRTYEQQLFRIRARFGSSTACQETHQLYALQAWHGYRVLAKEMAAWRVTVATMQRRGMSHASYPSRPFGAGVLELRRQDAERKLRAH